MQQLFLFLSLSVPGLNQGLWIYLAVANSKAPFTGPQGCFDVVLLFRHYNVMSIAAAVRKHITCDGSYLTTVIFKKYINGECPSHLCLTHFSYNINPLNHAVHHPQQISRFRSVTLRSQITLCEPTTPDHRKNVLPPHNSRSGRNSLSPVLRQSIGPLQPCPQILQQHPQWLRPLRLP